MEFGITSLSRKTTTPRKLLEVRRAHWGVETGSHYRRDVTLREDATRFTIGNGARVLADINNLTLALIRQAGFINAAQARRFFAAHLSDAFSLLVTPLFLTLLQPYSTALYGLLICLLGVYFAYPLDGFCRET